MGDPEGRCKARKQSVVSVYAGARCTRKVWRDGFCKQHHPDTKASRREASGARFAAKIEGWKTMQERFRLQDIVEWLEVNAPDSDLLRRAQDELAKLSPVSGPQGVKE